MGVSQGGMIADRISKTTITDSENWDKVINDIDYVKVIPRNIEKTNVYSLAKCVKYY